MDLTCEQPSDCGPSDCGPSDCGPGDCGLDGAAVGHAVTEWLQRTTARQRAAVIGEELARLDLRHHHIGGDFVPMYCLPVTLAAGDFRRIKQRSEHLVAALIRLEKALLAEPDGPLRARLWNSLSPGGQHLVQHADHESGFSLGRRFRRLDGFLTGTHGFQVIEVNQAAPLAASFHDNAHRFSAGLLQRLGIDWQPRLLVPLIAEWLVAEYQHRHGTDRLPSRVAVPIEHGYPPKFSDIPAIAAAAEAFARRRWGQSIAFTVCLPWELSRQGERIRLHGKAYDMIWRNTVYLSAYRAQGPDVSEYEAICQDPSRFLVVNSARSWWTRTKEVLAVIWDDAACHEFGLSPSELSELRDVVPQTRNLKYEPDHLDEVLGRRQEWVSKPTDSGFGQGVEFGAVHSEHSWRELVGRRCSDGYVFQRVARTPRLKLTQLTLTGERTETVLDGDLCPYHVNGGVQGPILMRAAEVPTDPERAGQPQRMNLTQGGVLVPVMITAGDD